MVVKIKRAFKITRTKTLIAWFSFAKYNNSTTRILTSKVWYHISLYNEQCKLAIHFAEHNFGPFGHIFFVIVSFEPESKTLFRVLFSSLCLQILIFYFGLYRIFIFLARPVKRTSKQLFTSYNQQQKLLRQPHKCPPHTPNSMLCG